MATTQKSHAGTFLYLGAQPEFFVDKMTHKRRGKQTASTTVRVQYHKREFADEGNFCNFLKNYSKFNAIFSFFETKICKN